MKKVIVSVLFGWCLLTRTDTYTMDDRAVGWRTVSKGTDTATQVGDAVRRRKSDFESRYFKDTNDLVEVLRGRGRWVVFTSDSSERADGLYNLIKIQSEDACNKKTISDFKEEE